LIGEAGTSRATTRELLHDQHRIEHEIDTTHFVSVRVPLI
jgi:hypothetical protein